MKLILDKNYHVSDIDAEEAKREPDDNIYKYVGNYNGENLFRYAKSLSPRLSPWKFAVPADDDTEIVSLLQEGDEVYVSDSTIDQALRSKKKCIYLMTSKNGLHLCVNVGDDYNNGGYFGVSVWKYVVPVPKKIIITKKQVAEKFNYSVDEIEIEE